MNTKILFSIMILIFISSCFFQQPGIKLLNLQSEDIHFVSGRSGYFDEIVPVPMNKKYIYSICKENTYLKLNKWDLTGNILKEYKIPLFSRWYGATPYALSPDESKFAYYKDNTSNIYIYDLLTKTESLLCKNLVSNEFSIEDFFWMDDETLILALDDDADIGRKVGEIIKVDVLTKAIVGRLEVEDPSDCSFSSASMLLAVAPMRRGVGIKIIDLKKMIVISEIQNSNKISWMNLPAWNPDGTKLAYIDGNDMFTVYDINTKKTIVIQKIPKDNVCYFVGYPNNNTGVVKYGLAGGQSKMYFLDLGTKKIIRTISDIWGTAIFIDNGNVIAYEKH